MIVAVMSNKGGVGKTTISINIAFTLARRGRRVGLIDIDFHGANVPIMLSLNKKPEITADGIIPVRVFKNIEIMSLALLLRKDDDPCLWSGETKRHMVMQMFKSVLWSDPDVFVIDTPPSLGDENIVVAELANKIIIVTTAHPASQYDVRKMIRVLKEKVVAVVVNMYDLFKYDVLLPIPSERIYYVPYDPELQVNPMKPIESIEKLVDEVIMK